MKPLLTLPQPGVRENGSGIESSNVRQKSDDISSAFKASGFTLLEKKVILENPGLHTIIYPLEEKNYPPYLKLQANLNEKLFDGLLNKYFKPENAQKQQKLLMDMAHLLIKKYDYITTKVSEDNMRLLAGFSEWALMAIRGTVPTDMYFDPVFEGVFQYLDFVVNLRAQLKLLNLKATALKFIELTCYLFNYHFDFEDIIVYVCNKEGKFVPKIVKRRGEMPLSISSDVANKLSKLPDSENEVLNDELKNLGLEEKLLKLEEAGTSLVYYQEGGGEKNFWLIEVGAQTSKIFPVELDLIFQHCWDDQIVEYCQNLGLSEKLAYIMMATFKRFVLRNYLIEERHYWKNKYHPIITANYLITTDPYYLAQEAIKLYPDVIKEWYDLGYIEKIDNLKEQILSFKEDLKNYLLKEEEKFLLNKALKLNEKFLEKVKDKERDLVWEDLKKFVSSQITKKYPL